MSALAAGQLKNWRRLASVRWSKNFAQPIKSWKLQVGDTVFINWGDDKGKIGKILEINKDKNRVKVEGVAMVRKRVRPAQGTKGGIFTVEGTVHYSRCNLIDPSTGQPTPIRMAKNEQGKRVRVARKTGAIIPWPEKKKGAIPETPGPRDTPADLVNAITYVPQPELIPYLSAATHEAGINKALRVLYPAPTVSIYRTRRKRDLDYTPTKLRTLRLKRTLRNRMKAAHARKLDSAVIEHHCRLARALVNRRNAKAAGASTSIAAQAASNAAAMAAAGGANGGASATAAADVLR